MERQCVRPAGLSDFLGDWRVERTITDFRAGADSRFLGQCTWQGDAHTARCIETGELLLSGGDRFAASRTYIWTMRENGMDIAFHDGRPFHVLNLATAEVSVLHRCDPDLYRGSFDFRAWPVWQQTWRVQGPRKDYRSVTSFSPG